MNNIQKHNKWQYRCLLLKEIGKLPNWAKTPILCLIVSTPIIIGIICSNNTDILRDALTWVGTKITTWQETTYENNRDFANEHVKDESGVQL